MKSVTNKLAIALGLSACLALPGLAMADGWKQDAYRDHQRFEYQRDAHRDHDRWERRERRNERWEHREHRYERWQRHEAREWREAHEWRDVYREYGPRGPGFYRMRPARYGGIYWTGVYFAPNPYLVIDLH